MQPKFYQFFLDETGDHGLSFIDENFPIFVLSGCLIEKDEYERLVKQIDTFKQTFFKTTEVVLHSREIRKCEGAFQILFDIDLKKKFYEELNRIIEDANFTIVSTGIEKKKHIEKYGRSAANPYMISLSYILERLIFCTDSSTATSELSIVIEKRGLKEDQQLLAHYNSVIDSGTYHVSSARFQQRISKFTMLSKKDNNIGLQIADLCAYPIARHIMNSKEPYIPFKIIEDKLYCSPQGVKIGYGLKVFP